MAAASGGRKWEIKIRDQKTFWASQFSLPQEITETFLEFKRDYLEIAPMTYIAGKCRALRGVYEGYWQCDLPGEHCLIYWPDPAAFTVYIDYFGRKPPDWAQIQSK